MKNDLKIFLDEYLKKIDELKTKGDLSTDLLSAYNYTEQAYRNVLEIYNWLKLEPNEKQAKRIENLASCRKVNGNCESRLKTIQIYDLLNNALPYVKALSHFNKLSAIEELCAKELSIIDGNILGDTKNHITRIEVEIAFLPYFEKIQPFKMDMFKECYEKIETLYKELINLS
jgi:hypothetical protein